MRGSNPMQFGSVLLRVGLKRRHTKYGNVYEVVRRKKVFAFKGLNDREIMHKGFLSWVNGEAAGFIVSLQLMITKKPFRLDA